MANKPIKKFTSGSVAASVWKNRRVVEGEEVDICSVTINKSYKDKSDVWKTTSSLNVNEVPQAITVLQQADDFLKKHTE